MRILFFLLIGLFINSQHAAAQDTSAFGRPAYELKVAVDKESFYSQDIKAGPYVLPDNTIQLYPGETVYVEIEQENGVIKKMQAVPQIRDAAKTITISFTQDVKGKVHSMMMLKVTNPFVQQLVYKVSIYLYSQKKWVSTDVWPVEPGVAGIETWQDIIISVGLGDWTLQKNPS